MMAAMSPIASLLLAILPLIMFVLAEALASMRIGILLAIASAAVEPIFSYLVLGAIQPISFVTSGSILLLGIASLLMNRSIYFKFQPVLVAIIVAVVLSSFQYSTETIPSRTLPIVKGQFPTDLQSLLEQEMVLGLLNSIFNWLPVAFALDAVWVAVAAYRWSTVTWLVVSALGTWVLSLAVVVIHILLFAAGDSF